MAKKRRTAYGDGGIYSDPQRPGHYIVQIPTGHGKYVRRRAMDAQSAEALYKELIAKRGDRLDISASAKTLQWLVLEWKEKIINPRQETSQPYAPKTILDYRTTITRYLLPDWGTTRIEEFNVRLVLEIYHVLRKKFSEYIAHKALTKLHMLLQVAIRWGYLGRNAVDDARPDIPPYVTPERPALAPEETARLFETVKGHRNENMYHVALTLGTRPAETLALQWGDINWVERTITIRRQVQEIEGKMLIRNLTKYGEGKRKLPLPSRLYDRLWAMYQVRLVSVFIFPNDEETGPILPRNFNRHFCGGNSGRKDKNGKHYKIIGIRQHAKLPKTITPHCFRHTVGTRLMELVLPDEIRDAIMGHGKQELRGVYAHARLQEMRKALERLEERMFEEAA